jgi:hypothetical protein
MPLNRCRRGRWAHPDRLLPRPQAQTRRTLSLVVDGLH